MASVVGIVNSALRKIGAATITSLTDGSRNANVANDLYEEHRDDLLRSHPWNFAVRRIQLARSATDPNYEYDYQYAIPSDFIRAIEIHDNEDGLGISEYRLENSSVAGRVILSSADQLWLTYVFKVTDPNTMTSDFRKTLSYSLAMDFAVAIAQSNTLADRMEVRFRNAKSKARSNDGMEDFPEQFPAGTWVNMRFSDSFGRDDNF